MSRVRVYIKPFDFDGSYQADYMEVTKDVLSIGQTSQALDNTDYDVGVFRNSSVQFALRNDHGRYLDAGNAKSIFRYKRADSLVKITWAPGPILKCGFFKAGQVVLSQDITVFEGLLSDSPTIGKINDQKIQFQVLGFESLFDRVEVPFSDLAVGDKISEIIYDCLNQTDITNLLTIDSDNIVPGIDQAVDSIDSLENQTVTEALQGGLLFGSNSVLYIQDRTVYVSDRSASSDLKATFYGQASTSGIENIVDIANYRDGQNRTYNFWTFSDTTLFSRDADSIAIYGIKKPADDVQCDLLTDSTKQQNLIDDLKTEFSNPKIEFDLTCPITSKFAALFLKDKVSVDYPTIYKPADENILPRWGQPKWGSFRYPVGQWSLTIDSSDSFKIMSKKMDFSKDTITFGMRKI